MSFSLFFLNWVFFFNVFDLYTSSHSIIHFHTHFWRWNNIFFLLQGLALQSWLASGHYIAKIGLKLVILLSSRLESQSHSHGWLVCFYLKEVLLCMYRCSPCVYVWVPVQCLWSPEEGIGFSRTGIGNGCNPLCRYQELNLSLCKSNHCS